MGARTKQSDGFVSLPDEAAECITYLLAAMIYIDREFLIDRLVKDMVRRKRTGLDDGDVVPSARKGLDRLFRLKLFILRYPAAPFENVYIGNHATVTLF